MGKKKTKVGVLSLIPMIYFYVSSGGFGAENLVSEVGPGMALIVLIAVPLLYSLPSGLIFSELAAVYPDEGGMYQWVDKIMGEKIGFLSGWCYTLCGFVEPGLFTVLVVGYFKALVPYKFTDTQSWLLCVALIAALALINILGVKSLSIISVVATILTLIPFVSIVVLGTMHWQYNPVQPFINSDLSIWQAAGSGVLVTIWLNCGYESIGTMSGEIENGGKLIPKAIKWAVPIISVSYIIIILLPLAGVGHWSQWNSDGPISFVEIAKILGGPILGVCMVLAGCLANATQCLDYLGCYSRVPFAMSEKGLFFKVFTKTNNKYGTPHASILITAAISCIACYGSFIQLVNLIMVMYAVPVLLTLIASIKLRITKPDIEASYKVWFKGPGYVIFAAFPIITYTYGVIADGIFPGILLILSAIPAYIFFNYRRKNRKANR